MTANGRAYQHQLWAHATSEIGGGALPTPKASDGERGRDKARARPDDKGRELATVVRDQLLTPTATDYKGPTNWKAAGRNGPQRLSDSLPTGAGMYLNPSFVEEMMGFPIGWTV
jgi:hypothetical protein